MEYTEFNRPMNRLAYGDRVRTPGEIIGTSPDVSYGHINLGPVGAGALWAAGQAPGLFGLPATLARFGMKAYNTGVNEDIRQGLGLPGQSVGQWLGGILGLNDRGSLTGNNTIANRQEFANPYNNTRAAVTTGGLYDDGGFFGRMLAGLFGGYADPYTSYTPEEARMRLAAARYNPATYQRPAVPAPIYGGPIPLPKAPPIQNPGAVASYGAAPVYAGGGYGNTTGGGYYGDAGRDPNGWTGGGMAGPISRNQATGMLSRI